MTAISGSEALQSRSFGKARGSEQAVVCQQPPVVRSPQFGDGGDHDRTRDAATATVGGCRNIGAVQASAETPVMALNFVSCDRGQLLLMPPSLVEWLPEDHLVWTVLGVVDQMDLGRFREGYRLGASGRAPYDPTMLVALLLYAYARGNRSSRRIERACWEDVAYKVICSMRVPDHSTIAEFRRRHESEIAELFDQVLGLCREAGLVSIGVIMVDGDQDQGERVDGSEPLVLGRGQGDLA
jgi:transposase